MMKKPSIVLRAILAIGPFLLISKLPGFWQFWQAAIFFSALIAMGFHYVISVFQWRGFNGLGKSMMLLHLVGLGIGAWPLIVNHRGDWTDAVVPSLLALVICPVLAIFVAVTIEKDGRSGGAAQGGVPDSEGLMPSPSPSPSPAVANILSQAAARSPRLLGREIKGKSGRSKLKYATISAFFFWLSYRVFLIDEPQKCAVLDSGSFRTSAWVRNYVYSVLESVCEAGGAPFLAAFFFVFAAMIFGTYLYGRNRESV